MEKESNMSNEFEDEMNKEKKYKPCRVCGNYGYNYPSGGRSAQKCPACRGDKISRDPHVRYRR